MACEADASFIFAPCCSARAGTLVGMKAERGKPFPRRNRGGLRLPKARGKRVAAAQHRRVCRCDIETTYQGSRKGLNPPLHLKWERKMKKALTTIAALALCAGLVACNQDKGGNAQAAAPADTKAAEQAIKDVESASLADWKAKKADGVASHYAADATTYLAGQAP